MSKQKIEIIKEFAKRNSINVFDLDDFIQLIAPGLETYYFVCSSCNEIIDAGDLGSEDKDFICFDCVNSYSDY